MIGSAILEWAYVVDTRSLTKDAAIAEVLKLLLTALFIRIFVFLLADFLRLINRFLGVLGNLLLEVRALFEHGIVLFRRNAEITKLGHCILRQWNELLQVFLELK